MRPEFWTVPGIGFTIQSYGFFMFAGFLLALLVGWRHAKKLRCEPGIITNIALLGIVLGAIGCRLMHVLHLHFTQIRAGSIGVKEAATMGGGGEILGGVILATVGVIVYLKLTKRPVLQYLDVATPALILAMGVGRIGCFMSGCCWGSVCETASGDPALPWAVQFPYGSMAYEQHWKQERLQCPRELGWVAPDTKAREPIPRPVLIDKQVAVYADSLCKAEQLKEARADKATIDSALAQAKKVEPSLQKRRLEPFARAAAQQLVQVSRDTGAESPPTMADLRTIAAAQSSRWVHPTQLYDFVALTLLFFVLAAVLTRRRRPGTVLALAMLLYPVNRFIQEMIRADNPHDVGGLTISQALSIGIFVIGLAWLLWLRRQPAPEPAAEPAEEAAPEPARSAT